MLRGGYRDLDRCGIVAVCVACHISPIVVVVVYRYLCRVAVVCYGGNGCAVHPLGLRVCRKTREAACGERYLVQRYAVDMRALRRYLADDGRCRVNGDDHLIGIRAVFGVITGDTRPIVVVVVDGDRNFYAVLALCYGGLIFGVCPLPIAGKSYVANWLAVGYFIVAEVGKFGNYGLCFGDCEGYNSFKPGIVIRARNTCLYIPTAGSRRYGACISAVLSIAVCECYFTKFGFGCRCICSFAISPADDRKFRRPAIGSLLD